MFTRLRTLFLRYMHHHGDRMGGFTLPRDRGRVTGHVERVIDADGVTRIIGWSASPSLTLNWPDGEVSVVPSVPRPDVAARFGLPLETGFEIQAPINVKPFTLTVTQPSGTTLTLPMRHPHDPPTPATMRRLKRAFARDLLRATPAALRYLRTRDARDRTRVKRALGLEITHGGLPLLPAFLAPAEPARATGPVTIIVPVHNAFDLLVECLNRVVRNTDLDWHLILIEDASTDDRVRPHLEAWSAAQGPHVELIALDQNAGFIGAVNFGLARAETLGNPVVLLNTDAMVPKGWASRLLAPLEADSTIASVTPMSNDAEIFSVPVIVARSDLAPGVADRLDQVAQTYGHPDLPSTPTGVGYCMAMSAQWLKKVPRLDMAFGRGYGEEVDWCQKVRAVGGKHVALPTLFVEHRGGHSFGSAAKLALVAQGNALIASRYPQYDAEVQFYITRDPLRTSRLALAVALAGLTSDGPLPLYLAHTLGGGAEQALMAAIAERTAAGQCALVLRVGGATRWQIEVHAPNGVTVGLTEDIALVRRLLEPVPALRVIYSCGVGDIDAVDLPEVLCSLLRDDHDDTAAALIHDFFVISPSYCLTDTRGLYCGPVTPEATDPAHSVTRPDGRLVPIAEWQAKWGTFLRHTDRITVFAQSGRDILLSTYPDIGDRIELRPHDLHTEIAPLSPPLVQGPGTLAVLGNLNVQKGAQVLCDMGRQVSGDPLMPRLVLVGNIDPAYALPPTVALHGTYRPSEIPELAARYGVTAWAVPSVWPETFSYTTHEMLATGLPVIGFDIGAQGEALRRAPNGIAVPYAPEDDHAAALLTAWQGTTSTPRNQYPGGTIEPPTKSKEIKV